MGRFGNFIAQFFARDDWENPLKEGGLAATRVPVSGETEMVLSAEGRTTIYLARDANLAPLIEPGNTIIVSQGDAVTPGVVAAGVPFCMPFDIETVEDVEPGLVRIEGPDLLSRLKDFQRWAPIGALTTTATTVTEAVADPFSTTVGANASANANLIALASSSGWQEGDEARITLNGLAGVHVTVVTGVNPEGSPHTHSIAIRDRLPYASNSGQSVQGRRRRVKVANAAPFQIGAECRLTLDNSSVHGTLIEEEPDEDGYITMRDGAPDSAAVGKAIQADDYSQPTTSDVDEIMSYMGGWDVIYDSPSYHGTAAGTHHAPNGESLYDLLVATSQRTGEFFRADYPIATGAPNKRIVWKRQFDYAGHEGNLRLVMPGQSDVSNEALNPNRGIITGNVRRSGKFMPVSRVVPYAGDQRITLKLCSEGAKLDALARGFAVELDSPFGLYTPPFVRRTVEDEVIGRTVTFSDVRADTDNTVAWQSAADALLMSAVYFLQSHGTGTRYQYEVEDVVHALPILPGQRVEMVYNSPDGKWSVSRTGANALYVLSVRSRFEPPREEDGRLNGGVKLTSLTLVESPYDIPDVARSAAGAIVDVARLARSGIGGTGGSSRSTTTVVTGGTASDHGSLSGLMDDDHPRYLLADGTRTMTGDLVLEDGKRVDGVDVSTHVADPAAHHAPVSAGNSGIGVVDQMIGLRLAVPSALELVDGLQLRPSAIGNGLKLENQLLSVGLATNSGLAFASGLLSMGTPGALSAATVNGVTGSSHTHTVNASDNPGIASQLLKTNTDGYVRLHGLGVGIAADGTSSLLLQSSQPNWHALKLKQRADQAAPMLRIENATGSALILLTQEGDLESGNPGFVSGHTGWQIAHGADAEFNNVRVRGELHATTFVADEMHATGGTMLLATATTVGKPVQADDNLLAGINVYPTKVTVTASYATGLCYFAQHDVVRIKSMGEVVSGGSLTIPDIYLEVQNVQGPYGRNLAEGNPGVYRLLCFRRSGGQAGYRVPPGSSVVKWTEANRTAGAYKGNMLLTADLQYGPYLDVFTVDATRSGSWPGSGETRTPPTIKPRVRLGNLDGVLGLPEQWGIAGGTDLSDTTSAARYFVLSDKMQRLQNIDTDYYNSGNRIIRLSTEGVTMLASSATYQKSRAFRWERSSGAVVGVVAASGDGDRQSMEMGVAPLFDSVNVVENGIEVEYRSSSPAGTGDHWIELKTWGDVYLSPGRWVRATNMQIAKGLVVGNQGAEPPAAGVIRIKDRPTGVVTPPTGFGDFYLVNDGSKQTLYFRFQNGQLLNLGQSSGL